MVIGAAIIISAFASCSAPPHYSGFDAQSWNNAVSPEERAAAQEYQRQQDELRYYSQQKLINKNKAETRLAEEFVETELALQKETAKRGDLKYYKRSGTPDSISVNNTQIDNSSHSSSESESKTWLSH